MTSGNKRFAQKAVAVVLIVGMLDLIGVPASLMFFVTAVVSVVWVVSRRSQSRELQAIFQFYIAAESILRDEERRWFAFELADVIDQGESALDLMPDPPPLQLFALGALYHKIGNHAASVEYLSRVEEEEFAEEFRVAPSSPLRRYVSMLRQLEQDPSTAPLVLGAIRNLERARRRNALRMLSDSRRALQNAGAENSGVGRVEPTKIDTVPPPISEVLQDIYHEDDGASAS